jgi:hypothetical protein
MKLDSLFFKPLEWLRLRIAEFGARTAKQHAKSLAMDRAGPMDPPPTAPAVEAAVFIAEARSRLSRLRANSESRRRTRPATPVTSFDESVFDAFKTSVSACAVTSTHDDVRTVFMPRDAAYAPTRYVARSSASEPPAGPSKRYPCSASQADVGTS